MTEVNLLNICQKIFPPVVGAARCGAVWWQLLVAAVQMSSVTRSPAWRGFCSASPQHEPRQHICHPLLAASFMSSYCGNTEENIMNSQPNVSLFWLDSNWKTLTFLRIDQYELNVNWDFIYVMHYKYLKRNNNCILKPNLLMFGATQWTVAHISFKSV